MQVVSPRKRLLIVDDEVALQRLARRHAERAGFDVVLATSLTEAMALAVSVSPSAILLDLILPDGSGLDGLARLKSDPRTSEIPVVIWSGSDVVEGGKRAFNAGAAGYFEKQELKEIMVKFTALLA
jgi:DNA-binding response OmpR family regulator